MLSIRKAVISMAAKQSMHNAMIKLYTEFKLGFEDKIFKFKFGQVFFPQFNSKLKFVKFAIESELFEDFRIVLINTLFTI